MVDPLFWNVKVISFFIFLFLLDAVPILQKLKQNRQHICSMIPIKKKKSAVYWKWVLIGLKNKLPVTANIR